MMVFMDNCNRQQSKNEMLLDLIDRALKKWKQAESYCQTQKNTPIVRDRSRMRATMLKIVYVTLLTEARKQNLSLTPKQLIERILYPNPYDDHMN
jgi:hypothetical protein